MAVRTNYCTNPSFELDGGSGLAVTWADTHNTAGAPTFSLVDALLGPGSKAQRIQLTSAADSAKYAGISVNSGNYFTGLAAGDLVTFSAYIKGSITGAALVLNIVWATAVGAYVGQTNSGTLVPSGTVGRFSFTHTAPATTGQMLPRIMVNSVDAGDTIDITIDDVLIEKSASAGDYFDGSYSFCHWVGAANASISISSGLTVAPVLPLLNTRIRAQGVM